MKKYILIVLVIYLVGIDTFSQSHVCGVRNNGIHKWISASLSPTIENSSFDTDFAEAMSKPLPDWYKEQKEEERKLLLELKENRERIIREFKAKYEVSEEDKIKQRDAKWAEMEARAARRIVLPWYKKAFGVKNVINEDTGEVESQERKEARERWNQFLEDEEQDTGFNLPGE